MVEVRPESNLATLADEAGDSRSNDNRHGKPPSLGGTGAVVTSVRLTCDSEQKLRLLILQIVLEPERGHCNAQTLRGWKDANGEAIVF